MSGRFSRMVRNVGLRMRRGQLSAERAEIESGADMLPPMSIRGSDLAFDLRDMNRTRVERENQTIQAEEEDIDRQLGRPNVGGLPAHTGQALQADVDEHADDLKQWKEQDRRR